MSILNEIPPEMAEGLRRAADIVRAHDRVRLISHYDADGISAAAIVRDTLRRMGKETDVTIYPTLSDEQMEMTQTIEAECVVMTDLGTSYLQRLDAIFDNIVILDHHKIAEDTVIPERDGFAFVNPLLYGIDGSKNACGAAMAYLFALTVDEVNCDLAPLALSGMYGDKQHLGGFRSIDKLIVDDAMSRGILREINNLAYPSDMTFYEAMMSCPEPYFKGTTGRADKVTRFIKSCELSMPDTPLTVTQEKIDDFAEALTSRMRRNGITEAIIKDTFGSRYYSERYLLDVSELSSILDGCGRRGFYEKAFDACESLDFTEALMVSQSYNDRIIENVEPVFERLVTLENIQYFVITERGMAGNIASCIVRYLGNPDLPVIGLTVNDDERTDVSSRGTDRMIERGLDLSSAMREVCGSLGGQGGGHIIASGGTIPRGTEKVFIERLDAFIGRQFAEHLRV